ncbi:MAG: hypothetical protein M0C28_11130 [Candidatus Moduliflexus flocculans]|nr:hypothetical protein [Candidatus Moduliflexus flocculans]
MTLRLRLVLTTLVAGVPALIALWVVGNSIRDARDDDLFNAMVLAHFSPAELDACDASPPTVPHRHPVARSEARRVPRLRRCGRASRLHVRSGRPGAASPTPRRCRRRCSMRCERARDRSDDPST